MNKFKLILASKSPRRFDLLKQRGVVFEVITRDTPELSSYHNVYDLPVKNAELKAHAVAVDYPDDIVIGADTIVLFENQVIGKPKDIDDAKEILCRLVGHTHIVLTGVSIMQLNQGKKSNFTIQSLVKFKPLTPTEINEYIQKIYVLDKAGAYSMQENHDLIVESYEGSFDNIVGLPVDELLTKLTNF